MKLVTVIIPCYNMERFLSRAIESVISQDYPDLELIIVDDCSTDRSYDVAMKYSQKYPWIKVEKTKENSGPSKARNIGLLVSQGEFIAFLDSDDVMLPKRISKQVQILTDSEYTLCNSSYFRVDENEKLVGYVEVKNKDLKYKDLLGNPCICISTLMIAKYKIKDLPLFSSKLLKAEDYYYYLSLIKKGYKVIGCPDPLVKYSVIDGSLSRRGLACIPDMFTILNRFEKINFFATCYYMIKYLYRAAKRRSLFQSSLKFKHNFQESFNFSE